MAIKASSISSICVYCGSRTGNQEYFGVLAQNLGKLIPGHGMELVYGAGSIGLMGLVARAAIEAGGRVTGIIPEHLDAVEITQNSLAELHITANMHDRKRMMFDRSDAFIVLPGGLGTLDETLEVMTWAQLSLHKKPVVLINYQGYWSPLVKLIDHAIENGFADPENRDILTVVNTAEEAIAFLSEYTAEISPGQSALF